VAELWNIGQKLHEDRAATERLRALLSAQQYQLANFAGEQWQTLLGYLRGRGGYRNRFARGSE
jgi:hypothetical protein